MSAPRIGQLWLWRKLPPMLFTYTEDGWMFLYADLIQIHDLIQMAERLGHRVWKRKTKPPGARRYVNPGEE